MIDLQNIKPQSFTQNEVTLNFNPARIAKGPTQGNPVLRVDEKDLTLDSVTKWYGGEKEVLRILIRGLRRDEASASSAAYDPKSDSFDEGKWRDEMSGTSSTTTLPELEDELEAAQNSALLLVSDESDLGVYDKSNPEHLAKFKEIQTDIKRLKAAIEVRKEIGRKRAETRAKNAEAKGEPAVA